jgi:hypothetical protein
MDDVLRTYGFDSLGEFLAVMKYKQIFLRYAVVEHFSDLSPIELKISDMWCP